MKNSIKNNLQTITPNWNVPKHITAFTTTVYGGVSRGDCATLNVGNHVGDSPADVAENRQRLQHHVGENVSLCWLHQTHSDIVVDLADYVDVVEADGAVTTKPRTACLVMTADCLPVLLCNQDGSKVAALHCGWKGLYQNLIGKTLDKHFLGDKVTAWLGPAIGQQSYEVDTKLYEKFTQLDAGYQSAFQANRENHYLFDLYDIATQQLKHHGVSDSHIFGGAFDTFSDPRFFSYRQSPKTGRIATLIYID